MKIQIASDLHTESWPGPIPDRSVFDPVEDRDLLILAGDIHVGLMARSFLKREIEISPVVYVLGNHEHYTARTHDTLLAQWRLAACSLPGLHLLSGNLAQIAGLRIYERMEKQARTRTLRAVPKIEDTVGYEFTEGDIDWLETQNITDDDVNFALMTAYRQHDPKIRGRHTFICTSNRYAGGTDDVLREQIVEAEEGLREKPRSHHYRRMRLLACRTLALYESERVPALPIRIAEGSTTSAQSRTSRGDRTLTEVPSGLAVAQHRYTEGDVAWLEKQDLSQSNVWHALNIAYHQNDHGNCRFTHKTARCADLWINPTCADLWMKHQTSRR